MDCHPRPSDEEPPCADFGSGPPDEALELALKKCDRRRLEVRFRVIEARLGTSAEQPDDLAYARAIAHQLRNIVAGERLRESVEGL